MFANRAVVTCYSDQLPANECSLDKLRGSKELVKHVLLAVQLRMAQISESGVCEGAEGHLPNKLFTHTCTLAGSVDATTL